MTAHPDSYSAASKWRSPSNIALIKYWGKRDVQLPMNPSVSFSLTHSNTITEIKVTGKSATDTLQYDFYFDGFRQPAFEGKISLFFEKIYQYIPHLQKSSLVINSHNTFPHSSGIASSASSMSAMALCLLSLENQLSGNQKNAGDFFKTASVMARLGSGSAARSLYQGFSLWGKLEEIEDSSDEYAIPVNTDLHPHFMNLYDSILIVEAGTKLVSSTKGHGLMDKNPFASTRFRQGNRNSLELLSILKTGDYDSFISMVESEAMTLHAMMLSSNPWFILVQPNTLEMIRKITDFRRNTSLPVCFTLDAGPNLHLIYPESARTSVVNFIRSELLRYCSEGRWIDDRMGEGPVKID
jgi:diphosphomevalonate decarboxylase